jgi:pheromone shutdown protein TraB
MKSYLLRILYFLFLKLVKLKQHSSWYMSQFSYFLFVVWVTSSGSMIMSTLKQPYIQDLHCSYTFA